MKYAPPTLDQAQSALKDALEPLTSGTVNATKEIWALEVLQLYAVSRALNIPDSGVLVVKEDQVELSKDELIGLLKKWESTGNVHVTTANPTNPSLSAGINWSQLLQLILPLLLGELLKRIGK